MCVLVVLSCRKCLPHVCFGQPDKVPLFLGLLVSGDTDASIRAIDAPPSSDFRARRPFRRKYIYGVGPAVADVGAFSRLLASGRKDENEPFVIDSDGTEFR